MSRRKRSLPSEPSKKKAPIDKKTLYKNILRLLILIALTVAVYLVYNVFIDLYFYPVIISYIIVTAVSTFAYVIYNRGFSRKGVTAEMLPNTMSDEEKAEFIEDAERRLVRSRPLLMVVFAFAFTLIVDAFTLFAIPFFKDMFIK